MMRLNWCIMVSRTSLFVALTRSRVMPLGVEESLLEARWEITLNVLTLFHFDSRINKCELEIYAPFGRGKGMEKKKKIKNIISFSLLEVYVRENVPLFGNISKENGIERSFLPIIPFKFQIFILPKIGRNRREWNFI